MKLSFTSAAAALLLFILAVPAHAATLEDSKIGQFLKEILNLVDSLLIPLLFAIALLAFLWGVVQFLIAGAADEERREKGKKFVVWGIIGLAVMSSVWGLVNLLGGTITLDNRRPDLPTFKQSSGSNTNSDSNTSGSSNTNNPFTDSNGNTFPNSNASPGSEDGF